MPSDLTDFLAIYGAIVATVAAGVSLTLAVREIRKDRRALRITCRLESVPSQVFAGENHDGLVVKVLNNGPRPIEVADIGLLRNDSRLLSQRKGASKPISLPRKLEFGESVSVSFYLNEIIRIASESGVYFSKAVVIDGEDRSYTVKLPKFAQFFPEV